jgi:hypothetical protein
MTCVLCCSALIALGHAGNVRAQDDSTQLRLAIERILHDAGTTAQHKVASLREQNGELATHDAEAVARLLAGLDGSLLLAASDCLFRCGGESQAIAALLELARDHHVPAARWAAAVSALHDSAFTRTGTPGDSQPALAAVVELVSERLNPSNHSKALLEVLGERTLLWDRAVWLRVSPIVVERLATLAAHPDGNVRIAAALVLSGTERPELVPQAAILPLAHVVLDGDERTAVPVHALLQKILRIGPEPSEGHLSAIRKFWSEWIAQNGEHFDMIQHLLAQARQASDLPFAERTIIGDQILSASTKITPTRRSGVFRQLHQVFESDPSPPNERASAWLKPLVHIASLDKGSANYAEAVELLLQLSAGDDPELRFWAVSLVGELPGATHKGTATRALLDRLVGNMQAPLAERAFAAWSLRHEAASDRELVEQLVSLGEELNATPEEQFSGRSRLRCIGQVSGALTRATRRRLGMDPARWREALADWHPTPRDHAGGSNDASERTDIHSERESGSVGPAFYSLAGVVAAGCALAALVLWYRRRLRSSVDTG